MKRLIISLIILLAITMPISINAAFKVYLKNGKTITGVERIEEGERIKIYKEGVLLELPRTYVIKIEKYETTPIEKKVIEEKAEEQPAYLRYEEKTETTNENLQRLKNQYDEVTGKLKRIEELEQRSRELQRAIHRKAYSPREARMLKQEKGAIDRELEDLRLEEESLLQQKEDLEYRLGL